MESLASGHGLSAAPGKKPGIIKEETMHRWIARELKWAGTAAALLLALGATAEAQLFKKKCAEPCPIPCPQICPEILPVQPAPKEQPKPAPMPEQAAPIEEPIFEPEQFAATGGGENFAGTAPQVIGDSAGGNSGLRAGALKIAENQTVLPRTRVFFSYNYFNNVNDTDLNVHRQIPGFEYAFWDGIVSMGVSLPLFETEQSGDFLGIDTVGNLNFFTKVLIWGSEDNRHFVSGGMSIAAPTGQNIPVFGASSINAVFFQPFAGYYFTLGERGYFQGFSSVAIPTDSRDFSVVFNDLSVGYWAFRGTGDGALTGLVPVLETHINTPVNKRGTFNTPVGLQDSVVITGGVHALFRRAIVTFGAATPITGPQPFDIEGIAQVNVPF